MKMNNREKLNAMYEYALKHALCCNRKTFAALIGISPANLSNALSESLYERYCTNGILNKANAALGYLFCPQWLQDGIGNMLLQSAPAAPEQEVSVSTHQPVQEMVVSSDSARVRELEYVIETQKKLIDMLERENEELKKETYSVSVRAKNA